MQPSPCAETVRPSSLRVCMPASCPEAPPANDAFGRRVTTAALARSDRPHTVVFRRDPRSHMSRSRRALGVGSLAALVAGVLAASPAQAAPSSPSLAPVQGFLADQLSTLAAAVPTTVLVHGTDIAAARSAVRATGMRPNTGFRKIGGVVA